jgi:hypothetical protein
MNVFLIKVGQFSRKGIFQEYTSRAVMVSKSVSEIKLFQYFQSRYQGLKVLVDRVEEIQDLSEEIIPLEIPDSNTKKEFGTKGIIKDFKIKLTKEEEISLKEINVYRAKTEKLKQDLEHCIKNRFSNLSYTNGHIKIEIDYYEVKCLSLGIMSDDFFKVVKSGVEDDNEQLNIKDADSFDKDADSFDVEVSDIPF